MMAHDEVNQAERSRRRDPAVRQDRAAAAIAGAHTLTECSHSLHEEAARLRP